MSNVKSPSVTCVSTETTRQTTRYVPGGKRSDDCREDRRIGRVDVRIAGVDLLAGRIDHAHAAKRRLERLGEPEPHLVRRFVHGAADGGQRVIEERMRRRRRAGNARDGGNDGSNRETRGDCIIG